MRIFILFFNYDLVVLGFDALLLVSWLDLDILKTNGWDC